MARLTLTQLYSSLQISLFFTEAVTALTAVLVAATETRVFILLVSLHCYWFSQHHSLVNKIALNLRGFVKTKST